MILPDVSRVLACLYEKDIKFETHTASYKSLLRLQALTHAPVPFYDGPTFLDESREICRYIAETYEHHGYPFLLGKDALERAFIEQWLHHEEHAFNPPSRSLFCHLAFPLDDEDEDIDLQKRKLEEVLEVYEQRLSDSEFLAGNKFTLADLVHLPNSHYITASDKFVYLYDSRKNVQRWWNAISTRDSWQKVLRDIKKVEQQQWQREHPTNTGRQTRLDPRKHFSTKSQTILVPHPVDTISTSPTTPQSDKPYSLETFPDETPVPSSLSTPHKSSAVQSAETTYFTTHRETPPASFESTPSIPEKSPIPSERTRTPLTPATSPTTAEKPPRIAADKSSIRDASIPSEATETDLPTKPKPSSSKEVSNNLHVFDIYKASSRTDEAATNIEPTPKKTSEILDKFSETDGLSDATVLAKPSPRSTKEDSDQLSASDFYKSDSTVTSVDSQDKESVQYTECTPQRPAETIYGRATVQRAADTSPGKLPSTEAHQTLQVEQWHATTAGLSNLKGDTDHLMSTQQVKPSKDLQQYSSQDSEQASTPLAQEPVSMDGQLVEGPEMKARTPYTDQRRDVSSMLWRQAADARGFAEEDEASSDHRDAVLPPCTRKHAEEANVFSADRRKAASLPKRVTDEDAQAIPFQTVYDDAHDTAQEARETASAPRRTRAQDAQDTSEGIGTYDSVSSRSQHMDAPQDAPPSNQEASEGPHRATASFPIGYPGAQEFIKQARENPASRPSVPHNAQGSTEEETAESSSSKAQLLDSCRADASSPKQILDEHNYGAIAPLQTGYTDGRKQARDTAASRRMMDQYAHDAFEETKMADSASFRAQTLDSRQVDAPPQKQAPAKDPGTATSLFQKRYFDDDDTTKQSEHTASRPRLMAAQEVQDNFEETKAGDSALFREQPSDILQDATSPSRQEAAKDAPNTTQPSQAGQDTSKQSTDRGSISRRITAQDARVRESKVVDSRSSGEQPSDAWRAAGPLPRHQVDDARSTTAPFQKRDPDTGDATKEVEDTTSMPRRIAGEDAKETFEETKFSDSASSRDQPLDYQRTDAPSRKQEAIEDQLGATSPFEKRYAVVEDTTKHSRDTAYKPMKMVGQDAQEASEETKARDSALFRAQPPDVWRAATTPSKQTSAEDALSVTRPSPTRYPRDEDTSKQSRAAASTPKQIAAQDARDAYRESKAVDSTSSREQPSDARRAAVPLPKLEASDDRSTTVPFQERYPDTEGTTKEAKDMTSMPRQMEDQDAKYNFEETMISDSASSQDRPLDSWRADTPSRKQEAIEDLRGATSRLEQRYSDVEDTTKQSRDITFKPRKMVGQDARDTSEETKAHDTALFRAQPPDAWQAASTPKQAVTEDALSVTRPSRTRYPTTEDTSKQPEDTKETFEDTKVADSASSRAKPTYTLRPTLPLSEQAEAEDAQDKGRQSRETISAPKKMVSRDAQVTSGERKTADSTSREHSLDRLQASSPSRQAAAEDARGPTRGAKESFIDETKQSRDAKDTSKKSRGTFEETKGPDSTLPRAESLGAQNAQPTNGASTTPIADQRKDVSTQLHSDVQDVFKQSKSPSAHQKGLGSLSQAEAGNDAQATMSEETFSTEPLRNMLKESQFTSPKAQPTYSRGPIKVEKTPSFYQKDPLVAQDSHQQAQTLPNGVKADGSTPKRQQAPVVPSTSDEKLTASAPPRGKVRDDHDTEPFKKDTVDDKKEAPPLLGQEPTSQVQRASELLQEDVHDARLSTHGAAFDNKAATSHASEAQGSDTWPDSTPTPVNVRPSRGDELIRSSLRDQRGQLPESTQANRLLQAPRESASTQDVPSDALRKTEFAKPTSTEEEGMEPTAGPASTLNPQLAAADAEQKFVPSDQESVRAAQPLSSVESRKEDTIVSAADQTKAPQTIFPQQATPPAPNTRDVPDSQHVIRKTQGVTLDNLATDDSAIPLVPSREQVSRGPPRNHGQKDMTPGPGTRDYPASETQLASAKASDLDSQPDSAPGEVTPAAKKFALSDQDSVDSAQQPSPAEPRKEETMVAAAEQTKAPPTIIDPQDTQGMREAPTSDTQHASGKIQEVAPDVDLDKVVYEKTTTPPVSLTRISDAAVDPTPTRGDVHPTRGIEPGAEPPSATQAPPSLEVLDSVPTEDHSMRPSASPDAQLGRPDEVALAEQKFSQSAHSTQPPSSAEPKNDEIKDSAHSAEPLFSAAPDQAKDSQTTTGKQDYEPTIRIMPEKGEQLPATTQDVSVDASGKDKSTDHETVEPMVGLASTPDTQRGTPRGAAASAEQKSTIPDQDSTRSTQLPPSIESRKQVSNVAKADQTNVSQASTGPDATPSAADLRGPTSSETTHPSEKIQESTPDAYLTDAVKPLLSMTGTDPVQPSHGASFDLSSNEKTAMTQGDQTNTLPNVSLSANQVVGQSESSAGKGVLSEDIASSYSQKNLKGTSTEEKSKLQQQTDQSSTQSSKDDNIDANGTVRSNILTTYGDIQPSPPKESMEATEESRNQQQAGQAVFQSTQDNEKQVEETESQDTGTDEPEEMNLHENTNQKNNGTSQGEALDQSGKQATGVQLLSKNTNNGSKSTKDTTDGIQTDNKSENSLRTSEESKRQIQTEGKTQGGEIEAPASKTEQPKERDLPANSTQSINSQSQAEASDKSEEQSSSSIQNKNKNSSKLDGSTDDLKSGDLPSP